MMSVTYYVNYVNIVDYRKINIRINVRFCYPLNINMFILLSIYNMTVNQLLVSSDLTPYEDLIFEFLTCLAFV